jgi:hypothetical protein
MIIRIGKTNLIMAYKANERNPIDPLERRVFTLFLKGQIKHSPSQGRVTALFRETDWSPPWEMACHNIF